ncbi:hypothetical protein PHLGIDRAFT_99183 [Phlebiopsis gigantea 11061_1 CR5-6]|uniref:DUF292-domain-containing protein n=1 Tax=Phlebiopsis gigantea (strain 11061_1 CR5-6) TaxID=745531 RepID=A0A0C3PV91_PHLG1|nr:hypothetical protein PHLGIDRAFT_99183 [Phlebiopsis gigantea 11061_1 CR5-6]
MCAVLLVRLGVQRLRTLQEKKAAQAKSSRRDIAMLVEKGKIETARIKVENIINEDIYIELLELLELYSELLLARFGLLDQNTREPDPGVIEGVCAIIYAAPRTELKELHVLRDILMHKYGRDFSIAVMENKDGCVSERVTRKLSTHTPPPQLVDAYLGEIAKGYNIAWSPPGSKNDEGGDDDEGGVKSEKIATALDSPLPDAATISAEARSTGARTPKLPELPPTEDEEPSSTQPSEGTKPAPPEDDFEMLAKRFAALKKR